MQVASWITERRPTKQIHVGAVAVGGGAPITVQSMTITKTADVEGTLQQIYALAAAQPRQHPPTGAHQGRGHRSARPRPADPNRRQRRLTRSGALREARRPD